MKPKVRILSAKMHKDLQQKVNDFIEDTSADILDIQYQDTNEGCSVLIRYYKG